MKRITSILTFVLLVSNLNAQHLEFESFSLEENIPTWCRSVELKDNINVNVIGTINPFYLEADYNGDSVKDIAIIVKEKSSKKRGILIIHGATYSTYLIGAGNKFGSGGDDYYWMDVWKLYKKSIAHKTIFSESFDIIGSEPVKLNHIAIEIASSEGSSNLIVWDGNQYVWIHTGS